VISNEWIIFALEHDPGKWPSMPYLQAEIELKID
jgi:hypothetical protein